jgi:hypothetical protein
MELKHESSAKRKTVDRADVERNIDAFLPTLAAQIKEAFEDEDEEATDNRVWHPHVPPDCFFGADVEDVDVITDVPDWAMDRITGGLTKLLKAADPDLFRTVVVAKDPYDEEGPFLHVIDTKYSDETILVGPDTTTFRSCMAALDKAIAASPDSGTFVWSAEPGTDKLDFTETQICNHFEERSVDVDVTAYKVGNTAHLLFTWPL